MSHLHRSKMHRRSALNSIAIAMLYLTSGPFTLSVAAKQCQPAGDYGLGSLEKTHNALAASRARHIARLHDYAAAGKFPLNTDFPGRVWTASKN
jgi:hypothetical protein